MKVAYLIDTDWIIDYLNDSEPVASRLEELRGEGIGISIISLAELYEGVYKQGLLIGDLDIFIASTSLYYGLPLCTNNRKHYERIESLHIISV